MRSGCAEFFVSSISSFKSQTGEKMRWIGMEKAVPVYCMRELSEPKPQSQA